MPGRVLWQRSSCSKQETLTCQQNWPVQRGRRFGGGVKGVWGLDGRETKV